MDTPEITAAKIAGDFCFLLKDQTESFKLSAKIKEAIELHVEDALERAALICDRSEDKCTFNPTCHAHDSCEIRALKSEDQPTM